MWARAHSALHKKKYASLYKYKSHTLSRFKIAGLKFMLKYVDTAQRNSTTIREIVHIIQTCSKILFQIWSMLYISGELHFSALWVQHNFTVTIFVQTHMRARLHTHTIWPFVLFLTVLSFSELDIQCMVTMNCHWLVNSFVKIVPNFSIALAWMGWHDS